MPVLKQGYLIFIKMEFCMISNINNGNYIQQTNINKVDNIHQVQGVQNVQNNKVDDIKSAKKLLRRYNPHSYMLRTGSGHYIVYYGAFKYKKSAKEFLKKIKSDGTVIAIKDIEFLLKKEQNQDAKLSLIASMR